MIADLLRTGANNARTGRELCNILRITRRALYAEIERERRAGYAICASRGEKPGYYLASYPEEAERYTRVLDASAREMKETARAIRVAAAKLPSEALTIDER